MEIISEEEDKKEMKQIIDIRLETNMQRSTDFQSKRLTNAR